MLLWWQKLIIIVVISIFVVGCILGGLAIGLRYIPKSTAVEAVSVETTESTKAQETVDATTPVETTATTQETSGTQETFGKVYAEGEIPAYEDSKDGVPDNGTVFESDVSWDEILIYTCGPAKYLNIVFPGGVKRGTVIIEIGAAVVGGKTFHYTITDLIPGAGWAGNVHYQRPITEKDWMAWVNLKVDEMMGVNNASDGLGCNTVDVIVTQNGNILFQKTYEK